MTATVADDKAAVARRVPVSRGYRFELVKLVSQWRIRVLVLACWIAPALFVAGVSRQSTPCPTPSSVAGCTPRGGPGRW